MTASPVVSNLETSSGSPGDPITLYTTTWCGDCRLVKRYFASHKIAYIEVNIEDDPTAASMVEQWNNGMRSVPTFRYKGRVITEPSVAELDALFA
jgi:mycoredoxin